MFFFPNLDVKTLLLSNINTTTAERHGLKQNQSVVLFTLVKSRPTKVGIARHLGESVKIFHHIHGTAMPCDEGKDLVTIHHSTMDREYVKIRYPYVFSDPEDPSDSLGDIVTIGIYI